MSDTREQMPISPDLLEILVCPVSKKKLALSDDQSKLVCVEKCSDPKCQREYPIVNGIPRMLVED